MACQFLGDEWFIEQLAFDYKAVPGARTFWQFQLPNVTVSVNETIAYRPRLAGFVKNFKYTNNSVGQTVNIDLLTVKGAGHFVPLDRPGPSLQMIYNFVKNRSYNTTLDVDLTPKPILPSFVNPPSVQRKFERMGYSFCLASMPELDRVYDLPGLTYPINFKQHSGYLPGATQGNYLHYW